MIWEGWELKRDLGVCLHWWSWINKHIVIAFGVLATRADARLGSGSRQQRRLGTFHADERRCCCCGRPPRKTERDRAGLSLRHAEAVLVWRHGRSHLCAALTAGRKQPKVPWHKVSMSAGNAEMEKILISLSDWVHKNTHMGLMAFSVSVLALSLPLN